MRMLAETPPSIPRCPRSTLLPPLPAGSANRSPVDWADFCLLLEDKMFGFPYLAALPKLADFAGRGADFVPQ